MRGEGHLQLSTIGRLLKRQPHDDAVIQRREVSRPLAPKTALKVRAFHPFYAIRRNYAMSDLLHGFWAPVTLPIQWGDQDAFGHVNNVVYLRWLETARIVYLDAVGLGHHAAEATSAERASATAAVGPILASVTCDFLRQLHYGDEVTIASRTTKIGNTSLTLEHLVASRDLSCIVARGISVCVAFDYTSQTKVTIPEAVRQEIAALEGNPI